jgi:hypothetical protein
MIPYMQNPGNTIDACLQKPKPVPSTPSFTVAERPAHKDFFSIGPPFPVPTPMLSWFPVSVMAL